MATVSYSNKFPVDGQSAGPRNQAWRNMNQVGFYLGGHDKCRALEYSQSYYYQLKIIWYTYIDV